MKNKYLHSIITFVFFIGISSLHAAPYYWVGGSGNWSDFATHWATTSGGNTFHTSEPTATDDVFFDSNSFTTEGQVVTATNSVTCKDFNWSGVNFSPSFQDEYALNIYGDITLHPDVNFSCRNVSLISSSNIQITSNGGSLGDGSFLLLYGAGYTIVDNLSCGSFNLTKGTLFTNNQKITVKNAFGVTGPQVKELNLGNSNIYCQIWNLDSENTTLNAGGSNIHVNIIRSNRDGVSDLTYNNITSTYGSIILEGSSTFNVIDLASANVNSCKFEAGTTTTFQNILTSATKINPIVLDTESGNGFATLKKVSGTLTIANAIVRNLHTIGGADFIVNPGTDGGGNVGWTFTDFPIQDYYWVGDSGDWEDLSHWASTSGGTTMYSTLPSRFDRVIFDENSFTISNAIVKINDKVKMKEISCRNLDGTSKISAGYGKTMYVYGDIDFSGIIKDIYSLDIVAEGDTIDIMIGDLGRVASFFSSSYGVYNLRSNVKCNWFNFYKGTLNTNGFDVESTITVSILGNLSNPTVINMGDSKFSCNTFELNGEDLTMDFNAGTSQISVTKDFIGSNQHFYHVILNGESLVKDDNSYEILECAPGSKNIFSKGSTQTINGEFRILGTSQGPISIASSEAGTPFTFSKSSGVVNANFLTISDNIATGGATFNATKSIDNGNNVGWNIEGIVPHDYYWVGGTGDWSDVNHWAKSSGGTEKYIDLPSKLDDVFFDANSFSADGQTVTLDIDDAYFHNMDWSGVTNHPMFSGHQKTINIDGSLVYSNQMSANVSFYRFTGNGDNVFNPGFENSPGDASELYFNSEGSWSLQSDLTTRIIEFEGGTFNTNNHNVDVLFNIYFGGFSQKEWNLGTTDFFTRGLSWFANGNNLTFNGSNSNFICSSTLSPNAWHGDNVVFNFHNMKFLNSVNITDVGKIYDSISVDTLFIEAGKKMQIYNNIQINVKMLIANGTQDEPIILKGSKEGVQAKIYKDEGTVLCDYLQLKDIAALGGASFIANHSVNQGNVAGWSFTGQIQTITFPSIDDVSENFTGEITLMASASSGLPVTYELIAGQATLNENKITISGPGKVKIRASQIGNSEFNPATSVSQEFCVIPSKPSLITSQTTDGTLLTSSSLTGNIWYLDNQLIDGAIEHTYLPVQTGDYSVQIDLGGCLSEISDVVHIMITSSKDIQKYENLKVTPNPVNTTLNIQLDQSIEGEFKIVNTLGSVLKDGNFETDHLKIDTQKLPTGTYWILIYSNKGDFQSIFVKE